MINMYNMVEVGEQLYAGLPVEPAHARTGAGGSLKSAQVQPVELDLAARTLTKKNPAKTAMFYIQCCHLQRSCMASECRARSLPPKHTGT